MKIEKKITAYQVKKDVTPETPKPIEHKEAPRPEYLVGCTYKIKTPVSDHALYITINDVVDENDERHPYEIFINTKDVAHFQWVIALTRVISAVFRKGGDNTFLVEELKSVFDPKGGYYKRGGVYMNSLVAEIGHVIESHMKHIGRL